MVSFESDYIAGAHPKVLEALVSTNLENLTGYGADPYCARAAEKIRLSCACPEAEVFFLTGGTQTNQTVIGTMLRPWEGVVAASTGHVAVHEAGAIEYTGHKVLTVPGHEGKLTARSVEDLVSAFYADGNHDHMVFPGMVYISYPTEYGTLYTRKELEEIHAVCRRHDLPLFIDGARLIYGLRSLQCDLTMADLASLCDVFYIGGTKAGALCGEALVFPRHNAPAHFMTQVKQHGALLAKGRLLGVQFDALFTDGLWQEIGDHAIECAEKMKEIFRRRGCTFFLESPTNQQFITLENGEMARLAEKVAAGFWETVDGNHTALRFATSWSTTEEDLEELEKALS